jgi:hypothetical protein
MTLLSDAEWEEWSEYLKTVLRYPPPVKSSAEEPPTYRTQPILAADQPPNKRPAITGGNCQVPKEGIAKNWPSLSNAR